MKGTTMSKQGGAMSGAAEMRAALDCMRAYGAAHPDRSPIPLETDWHGPLTSDETLPLVENVRAMVAAGIRIQSTGEATDSIVAGALDACLAHIDELTKDLQCALAVGKMAAKGYGVSTLASWMLSHGYATGHGDSVEGLLGELEGQIEAKIADLWRASDGYVGAAKKHREAELTRLRENSASVWKIAQNEIAALRADALNDLAYAHGAHAALAAMHGGMPEAEFLAQVEKRSKEPRAELTRLREENINLRNSHAAVVQEAYERLSAQREDIARKDEALREARKTIVAWVLPNPPNVIAAACSGVDAALHPLAPGSKPLSEGGAK